MTRAVRLKNIIFLSRKASKACVCLKGEHFSPSDHSAHASAGLFSLLVCICVSSRFYSAHTLPPVCLLLTVRTGFNMLHLALRSTTCDFIPASGLFLGHLWINVHFS